MEVLGIDIGGTGIKGAVVDVTTGELMTERHRIPTPQPATPGAVADVVAEIVRHFDWSGRLGCTLPARVEHGLVRTATHIQEDWVDTRVDELLGRATGLNVHTLNDADAAGVASMAFGAGKDRNGFVFFVTVGTGIGTALFIDHHLVPNTELGHLTLRGMPAENYASNRVREDQGLSWVDWARRFQEYLDRVEFLFAPDTIIIGGGISRPQKAAEYMPYLSTNAELLTAALENEAGIIGAAWVSAQS
jgi:polyphosphate glucokinase